MVSKCHSANIKELHVSGDDYRIHDSWKFDTWFDRGHTLTNFGARELIPAIVAETVESLPAVYARKLRIGEHASAEPAAHLCANCKRDCTVEHVECKTCKVHLCGKCFSIETGKPAVNSHDTHELALPCKALRNPELNTDSTGTLRIVAADGTIAIAVKADGSLTGECALSRRIAALEDMISRLIRVNDAVHHA